MRILYVEDNPANIFLVKRVARGHQVVNYIDGEEALRNFERDQPDLVLMDIQLAGPMNGLDAVRMLRSKGVTTPIIAVTAYAMVGDRERCLAAGCDDYLAKPLPIPHLLALFEKYKVQTTEQPIVVLEAMPKSTQTLIPTVTTTSTQEAPSGISDVGMPEKPSQEVPPTPLASMEKSPTPTEPPVLEPKANMEVGVVTTEAVTILAAESSKSEPSSLETNGGEKPPENTATLLKTNS
ncbi:MAG: response regulator [Chitinophagaceae bacterium]|nr:response regulator [Anaerolineae bacterium]